MKKTIHLLVFLLFFVSTKSNANNEKDCTSEVRAMISAEAPRNGHNPILAAQAFDLIVRLYKIKAIYLDSTETGMSHYSVLDRTLRINVRDGKGAIINKIFAELTHAVQFTWRPFHYTKNAFIVFGKTFFKAVFLRNRGRYKEKIDSVQLHSLRPISRLRAAFIGIYLIDAYCKYDGMYPRDMQHVVDKLEHPDCDVRSFEHDHPKIGAALWRLYDDLMFMLQHLPQEKVKKWLETRKRLIRKDLRYTGGLSFYIGYNDAMKKIKIGKSFADRVRDVVRSIPKGKTMSYGEVASRAGAPRAARAVGTIMAGNFDKTVPCHRVIRSDGKIGQYNRGGPIAKRALLKKEGVIL